MTNSFYPLTVEKIKKLTPHSVSISFKIPENLKSVFHYIPGQYITIKKSINEQEVRRAYSICSVPSDNLLSIGIKKMTAGLFSIYANENLKEGDVLEVHPPEGRFLYTSEKKQQNIAAFTAGSGITPIMSIMKTFLKDTKGNFLLVYGNKMLTETMFYDEIMSLIQEYPNRLTVHFIFSRKQEANHLFGRIEKSTINFIIKNKHKDILFDSFYLCGPEGMIETAHETLLNNGVPEENIKKELFSTKNETPDNKIETGKAQLKVTVDDEVFVFTMDKKQRVLEAVLANKIDAPYSCQGGICSSCIARVKEGQATMVKNQILTDSEVAEGLILTCQAHPVSDSLEIDYDDV